jgi:hypothetical protein
MNLIRKLLFYHENILEFERAHPEIEVRFNFPGPYYIWILDRDNHYHYEFFPFNWQSHRRLNQITKIGLVANTDYFDLSNPIEHIEFNKHYYFSEENKPPYLPGYIKSSDEDYIEANKRAHEYRLTGGSQKDIDYFLEGFKKNKRLENKFDYVSKCIPSKHMRQI